MLFAGCCVCVCVSHPARTGRPARRWSGHSLLVENAPLGPNLLGYGSAWLANFRLRPELFLDSISFVVRIDNRVFTLGLGFSSSAGSPNAFATAL